MPEKYHSHHGDVYFSDDRSPHASHNFIVVWSTTEIWCMLHQCTCLPIDIAYHEALHRRNIITRVQLHPVVNVYAWESPKYASHVPPNYMRQASNRRLFTPLGKTRPNERPFSEKATRNWTFELSSHATICHWAYLQPNVRKCDRWNPNVSSATAKTTFLWQPNVKEMCVPVEIPISQTQRHSNRLHVRKC